MFNLVNGFDILFQWKFLSNENFLNCIFYWSVCLQWKEIIKVSFLLLIFNFFLFLSNYGYFNFYERWHFHFAWRILYWKVLKVCYLSGFLTLPNIVEKFLLNWFIRPCSNSRKFILIAMKLIIDIGVEYRIFST